jgi:hypothetical protein
LPRSEKEEFTKNFEGGEIRIKPVEAMRRWNLQFKGQVERCTDENDTSEVSSNGEAKLVM